MSFESWFSDCIKALRFSWKCSTTTQVLLGSKSFQWVIFGCALAQIITTILLFIAYIKTINFTYAWWPLFDVFRLILVTMTRLDRLFPNTPRYLETQTVYSILAYANVFGFFWSLIFWPIFCYYLPDGTDITIVLVIMTIVYMIVHACCTLPSIFKIYELSTQSESIYSPNNAFMVDFINHDGLNVPNSSNENNNEDGDDPVLYSAPILNGNITDDDDDENNINKTDLIPHDFNNINNISNISVTKHNYGYKLHVPQGDNSFDNESSDLNSQNEILQNMNEHDVSNLENELLDESTILVAFKLPNGEVVSDAYAKTDKVQKIYDFMNEKLPNKQFELLPLTANINLEDPNIQIQQVLKTDNIIIDPIINVKIKEVKISEENDAAQQNKNAAKKTQPENDVQDSEPKEAAKYNI